MPNEAFFTPGGNYQAAEFRRLLSQFYTVDAGLPGGVIRGLAVTGGGGSNVSVAAGSAYILDTTNGAYIGYSTSASTIAIAPYVAGTPRQDTVYAYIDDDNLNPTSVSGELRIGVASNSTSIPSLAIPLARVAVRDSSAIGSATNVITPAFSQADLITVKNRYQIIQPVVSNDTGWVSIPTLNTGWSVLAGFPTPVIRKVGAVVQLHAYVFVDPTVAGFVRDGFTIPAGFRPPYTETWTVSTNHPDIMAQAFIEGANTFGLFVPNGITDKFSISVDVMWLV